MPGTLFQPPEHGYSSAGRVMLNGSKDPIMDMEWIAEAYQKVAHDRVAMLAEQRRGIRGGDEFEAYPIVFMYRQAFELMLKAIVFAGAVALREEQQEPMRIAKIMKHGLTPLFEEVCRILDAIGVGDEEVFDCDIEGLQTREDFSVIVREFDEIDRGSYAFRYSMKRDGTTPSLANDFEFDLFVSAAIMDKILPVLAAAPEWIRESLQDRWEAAYEAQQDEWRHDPPDYEGEYEGE
jgi:hypothetical protein